VRKDLRVSGGLVAGARLGRFALSLRYDLILNRSNVDRRLAETSECAAPDFTCHRYDHANESFDKHVLGLELALDW
jgi:hypothetical protein